jgi:hypothetical protein
LWRPASRDGQLCHRDRPVLGPFCSDSRDGVPGADDPHRWGDITTWRQVRRVEQLCHLPGDIVT